MYHNIELAQKISEAQMEISTGQVDPEDEQREDLIEEEI